MASVNELLENPPEVFMFASEILMKYADDILQNPTDEWRRSIVVGNPDITDGLMCVKGGVECLFDMGFEEDGTHFVYPMHKDLGYLRQIRNELQKQRESVKQLVGNESQTIHIQRSPARATGFVDNKVYPSNIYQLEKEFREKLVVESEKVMLCEDISAQQKAQQCIPLGALKAEAKRRKKEAEASTSPSRNPSLDEQDYLLVELLRWFKEEFFEWVDKPPCDRCGGETKYAGDAPPESHEIKWGALRIEMYKCSSSNCNNSLLIRFPRYNSPVKLLETRRGRCGEWANCFTLCCRAADFDTRFVVDWCDHVWVEVYSQSQQRWIHADPCENICDQPLLYETGWKKNVTYVIAFSKDEVMDVTWRYCCNHSKVLAQRLECREAWLLTTLNQMNSIRQEGFPLVKKKFLIQRLASELVELLKEAKPETETHLPGRTSGSLDWRVSRGETSECSDRVEKYTFVLNEAEIGAKRFCLKYSCSRDKYFRMSVGVEEAVDEWKSRVFECGSVFRKVEPDWKVAYIARREGVSDGYVTWKFDFENSGLKINVVKLCLLTATFEDGLVTWSVCDDNNCVKLLPGENCYAGNDFKGGRCLTLKAELSRGKGNTAWQHAQLFRQSLKNNEDYPLEVLITFL